MAKKDTTPHAPTKETKGQVKLLASFGVPQAEIARYIKIDPKTMRKYYRDELDNAILETSANVTKYLYSAASGMALKNGASHSDCIRAAMFWAKTRMGWREGDEQKQDSPIAINYYIHPDAA